MVDVHDSILKVDILQRQPTEFRDSHSGMKQNVDRFIVFAVGVVIVYEFQELPHLLFRDCFSGLAVVDDHTRKLEPEGVLDDNVIIDCHLKCRAQDTANGLYRTVASAIALQLDQEQLCVRGLDRADLLSAELFLLQKIHHKAVI